MKTKKKKKNSPLSICHRKRWKRLYRWPSAQQVQRSRLSSRYLCHRRSRSAKEDRKTTTTDADLNIHAVREKEREGNVGFRVLEETYDLVGRGYDGIDHVPNSVVLVKTLPVRTGLALEVLDDEPLEPLHFLVTRPGHFQESRRHLSRLMISSRVFPFLFPFVRNSPHLTSGREKKSDFLSFLRSPLLQQDRTGAEMRRGGPGNALLSGFPPLRALNNAYRQSWPSVQSYFNFDWVFIFKFFFLFIKKI